MTKMTREQAIKSYVEHLSGSELADLLQCINAYDGSFEEVIYYEMDLFDELMTNCTPSEIARMIYFGEFNPNDDYFRFDGYGNLESLDWQEISAEAEALVDDILYHLSNNYDGDTPWDDLTYIVDSDAAAVFNEDFEEVYEDDDDDE